MEEKHITGEHLKAFASGLLEQGYILISEAPDGTGFTAVKDGASVNMNTAARPTKASFKQQVFPKTEPVFHFRKTVDDVLLFDPLPPAQKTVVFGARPCDAKSISIMRKVFNWDYKDEFFNVRADNTVVIGTLCKYSDETCFCTSVGLSPSSTDGSDLFLVPLDDGGYSVKVVTEKGRQFIDENPALFGEAAPGADAVTAKHPGPAQKFDAAQVRGWIAQNFDHPHWAELGQTCLGCAQCAFSCPVCHCFDIVDEPDSFLEGRRMKNWDACQGGMFTKHASGHNPRDDQGKRYRQRVSHKFSYYPERFGEILCTGCGRCTRGCVVGVDIGEIAAGIARLA
jgi:ferredoxin